MRADRVREVAGAIELGEGMPLATCDSNVEIVTLRTRVVRELISSSGLFPTLFPHTHTRKVTFSTFSHRCGGGGLAHVVSLATSNLVSGLRSHRRCDSESAAPLKAAELAASPKEASNDQIKYFPLEPRRKDSEQSNRANPAPGTHRFLCGSARTAEPARAVTTEQDRHQPAGVGRGLRDCQ